jgi:hypothetical protein
VGTGTRDLEGDTDNLEVVDDMRDEMGQKGFVWRKSISAPIMCLGAS